MVNNLRSTLFKERYITINEILYMGFFIYFIFLLVISIKGLGGNFTIVGISGAIYLATIIGIDKYSQHISKSLPSKCVYNPFGFIEIHTADDAHGNFNDFKKICAQVILLARIENKNVVFCSWIINERNLRRILGDSLVPLKMSVFELLATKFNMIKYGVSSKKRSKKYLILTDFISPTSLKILEDYSEYY